MCRCALCVRRAGTRGPFHAPPQLKPRYEVKSGKKRQEGSQMGHRGAVCKIVENGKHSVVLCRLSRKGNLEKTRGVKDDRLVSEKFVREGISVAGSGTKETLGGTGSVSVHTVNSTHLLRGSRTGDAEGPWGLVGSTRWKHGGA